MPDAGPARTEVLDIARIEIAKDIFVFARPRPSLAGSSDRPRAVIANPLGTFTPVGCQFAIHLSERGVLPANQRDIVNADFLKPPNVPYRHGRTVQPRLVLQELAVSWQYLS